jgi:hypothetical protein
MALASISSMGAKWFNVTPEEMAGIHVAVGAAQSNGTLRP